MRNIFSIKQMNRFCEKCYNFYDIIEENGIPYNSCDICKIKVPHTGVSVIATFDGGAESRRGKKLDQHTLENLTYETSMGITADIKCAKCKDSEVIYVIDDSTGRYRYACRKCHKEVPVRTG